LSGGAQPHQNELIVAADLRLRRLVATRAELVAVSTWT
jgi:hypothetical protein